jgi:hypothetical protein
MKKVILLATVLLALAMTASAQKLIDFTHLDATATPKVVPDAYGGMRWSGIEYVDALWYGDANGDPNNGPGFYTGDEVMVGFGGGPLCFHNYGARVADGATDKHICEASISALETSVFQVDSAVVSDGWDAKGDFITVTAYNNGMQVGLAWRYPLSPIATKLDFSKTGWGSISELVIHPSPGGSFVIYTLELK